MDQCRSRLKLSENFERHWSIQISGEIHMDQSLVHTFSWRYSYGPMVLKVLLKFPPTLALVHGWLFPGMEAAENFWAEWAGKPNMSVEDVEIFVEMLTVHEHNIVTDLLDKRGTAAKGTDEGDKDGGSKAKGRQRKSKAKARAKAQSKRKRADDGGGGDDDDDEGKTHKRERKDKDERMKAKATVRTRKRMKTEIRMKPMKTRMSKIETVNRRRQRLGWQRQ